MKCSYCPTELVQNARFCHMCGKPVGAKSNRVKFAMGRSAGYPKVELTDEQLNYTDSSGRSGMISLGAITGIELKEDGLFSRRYLAILSGNFAPLEQGHSTIHFLCCFVMRPNVIASPRFSKRRGTDSEYL